MGLVSKTTEPNELKFCVELDFSYTMAQKKVSGYSDKVAITVIHVTCTGSFDVHSPVIQQAGRYFLLRGGNTPIILPIEKVEFCKSVHQLISAAFVCTPKEISSASSH